MPLVRLVGRNEPVTRLSIQCQRGTASITKHPPRANPLARRETVT